MARPLGSGPIHVFIGFGPPAGRPAFIPPAPSPSVGTPVYYGTTREGPDITEVSDFFPVMSDLTGPKQSLDEGCAGREDTIALTMSSWSQTVDNGLENFLRPAIGPANIGTYLLSDLGTLVLSEGFTLGIWLLKGAGAKAVNIASGMPLGRYYMTCIPIGPNKLIEGNKENLRVRVFRAKKDPAFLNGGTLPLFREDNAAFAGLPPATFG